MQLEVRSIQRLFSKTLAGLAMVILIFWGNQASGEEPLKVGVSLKIHQITSINQKAENFSAVATLRMVWHEPSLAYDDTEMLAPVLVYNFSKFLQVLAEKRLWWPGYSFYNLQGRIEFQNRGVKIEPSGAVTYIARFTGTFQAPDFDFKHFPLDSQYFAIIMDFLPHKDKLEIFALSSLIGLGDNLGEEEWILENVDAQVTTHSELDYEAPRFILSFNGTRHLNYYIVRIFIPVIIIIMVSWFTFFLKDLTKRIDLASGNLLMFIAFNFTIANDLPRLGYLTLMDIFLLGTFAITGLVVLVNVFLRQLQNKGRDVEVEQLDIYALWGYPLSYIITAFLVLIFFYR